MHTPRRVISLSPNVSMILFALGADDCVVGCSSYCPGAIQKYMTVWDIAEAAVAHRLQHWQTLPVAGVWPQANPEVIKELQPEIVLASGTGPLDAHDAQTFNVEMDGFVNFDTRTLADLEQHIAHIGQLVGKPEEAEHLIQQMAARKDEIVATRVAPSSRPTMLFEYCVCIKYDSEPQRRFANPARYIMVGGHLTPELIQLSGGEPLVTQPGDTVQWTPFAAIREAQPDVILLFDCNGCPNANQHPIDSRKGWSDLSAVSQQAVYRLSENISNPNLCFPAALEQLVGVVNDFGAR
jgi:iron complex transport system substrate-binding protein